MRSIFSVKSALVCCVLALVACTPATPPTTSDTAAKTTAANTATPVSAPSVADAHNSNDGHDHAAQSNIPHPEIRRISVDETQALVAKNQAFLVDVRGADAYRTGHIKGATLILSGDLPSRMKDLPRDKKIITYCA